MIVAGLTHFCCPLMARCTLAPISALGNLGSSLNLSIPPTSEFSAAFTGQLRLECASLSPWNAAASGAAEGGSAGELTFTCPHPSARPSSARPAMPHCPGGKRITPPLTDAANGRISRISSSSINRFKENRGHPEKDTDYISPGRVPLQQAGFHAIELSNVEIKRRGSDEDF